MRRYSENRTIEPESEKIDQENKIRIPSKNSRIESNKLTLQTGTLAGVLQRRSRLSKFEDDSEL